MIVDVIVTQQHTDGHTNRSLLVVLGGFGWFRLVPCFSNYGTRSRAKQVLLYLPFRRLLALFSIERIKKTFFIPVNTFNTFLWLRLASKTFSERIIIFADNRLWGYVTLEITQTRKLKETYLKSMFDWDSAESSVSPLFSVLPSHLPSHGLRHQFECEVRVSMRNKFV